MTKLPDVINSVHAFVFIERAKACVNQKHYEQALTNLDEALRLDPQSGEAVMIRAAARVSMGDYREGLADVERRLQMEPYEPMALLTRGNLRAELGEVEPALEDFTEFLRQQPGTVVALRARALGYARLQRFDAALADLDEALRVDPASADAWLERGRVYQNKGNYQAALADYQKGLDLAPAEYRFYNQYAWMLAACPQAEYRDGARAVRLAQRGCELTNWQDANLLDTLATAHAECGHFDEALTWANKALELGDDDIKNIVSEHVQLFRNLRPVRFEERRC